MTDLEGLCDDLVAEHDVLDDLVAALDEDDWRRATPAPGWTVRDQIVHLATADDLATSAIGDPEAFVARRDAGEGNGGGWGSDGPATGAAALAEWRRARARFVETARTSRPGVRVPWFGSSMSPASMVTARLMETWAHGQDVADAVGVHRHPSGRLRHVAWLGVRTRVFSYHVHDRVPDDTPVRVELRGPAGERWRWGPDDALDSVTGDAEEFCLVVTRRRHVDGTGLEVRGAAARDWMLIAQTFVGLPDSARAVRSDGRDDGST